MTPLSLIVALILVAGIVYCLWRPQTAIVAIIVQFPLEQLVQSYFPIAQRTPWLINAVIAGLAFVALLSRISQGKSVFVGIKNPVTWGVFALYGLAWIGLLWSPGQANGYAMLSSALPYFVLTLIIAPMLVGDLDEYRVILVPLMVTGSLVALLIFVNPNMSYYAGRMTLELGNYGPDQRGNPLALADVGAMIAMVAVLYRAPTRTPLVMAVRIAAFILGIRLAIVSGSRGQVLAAIACGLAFYPVARRVANLKQFVGVTIGLGILVMGFYFGFRNFIGHENETRWGSEGMKSGVEDRALRIMRLLEEYAGNPLAWPFGLGTNAHSGVVAGENYVHNFAVEVLCEEGLLGFAVAATTLWMTFAAGRRLWQDHHGDRGGQATVAILGAQAAFFLLLSMKQGTFLGSYDIFMYWLFVGKLAKADEGRIREHDFVDEWEGEELAGETADQAHGAMPVARG